MEADKTEVLFSLNIKKAVANILRMATTTADDV